MRHVLKTASETGLVSCENDSYCCITFTLCQQGITTELTANSARIAEINTLADQLVNTDHRHSADVKKRRKEINDM